MILLDIRKFVNNNLSIKGLTFGIMDICFALCITPNVPVVLSFNFRANFTILKQLKTQISFQAKSSLPYTEFTGRDTNNDFVLNDRPFGVARNTLRGTWFKQTDLRLDYDLPFKSGSKKSERKKSFGIQLTVTNLLNQTNYSKFDGNLTSPLFGKPISSYSARRIELGFTVFLF